MLIKAKFHFSELLFGMLLAVAIFALGAAFWSSHQSPSSEHTSQGEQKADDKNDTNQRKTQSLWVPVDSIGLYTLLLTAFTSVLAGASIFQGFMLLRADKTTRIAANAALRQANATIALERPILVPQGIKLVGYPDATNPQSNEDPAIGQQIPAVCRALVGFMSIGRTYARINRFCLEWMVSTALPVVPQYSPAYSN
jgi:hypothetical protein